MPRLIQIESNFQPLSEAEFLNTVPTLDGGIDISGKPTIVNPSTGLTTTLTNDFRLVGTTSYAQDFYFYVTTSKPNSVIFVNNENTFKTTPNTVVLNLADVVANSNKYTITVQKQGFVNNEKYEIDAVLTRKYSENTIGSSGLTPTETSYNKFDVNGNVVFNTINDSIRTTEPIYTTSPVYTLRIKKYVNNVIVPYEYNVDSQSKELVFDNFSLESSEIAPPVEIQTAKVTLNLSGADESAVYTLNDSSPIPISSGLSNVDIPVGTEITIASTNINQFKISKIISTGAVVSDSTNEGDVLPVASRRAISQTNIRNTQSTSIPSDGIDNTDSKTLTFTLTADIAISVTTENVVQIIKNIPAIQANVTDNKYNINSKSGFPISIISTGVLTKVKAYIGDSLIEFADLFKGQDSTLAIIVIPHKYISTIGNYNIELVPSNNSGDGKSISVLVNVVNETYVTKPDIQNITYPATIKGPDYVGTNVDFEISWNSTNTDFVKIGKVGGTSALQSPASGKVKLNVSELLKLDGTPIEEKDGVIVLQLKLTPYNTSTNKSIFGNSEIITIRFEKGRLTIPRNVAINRIIDGFVSQLDDTIFENENSKYLTHLLHLGEGNNKVITTWTGDGDSLILKLYEPLSTTIQPNQQVWISKIQASPIVETITISGESDKYCPPLKGPNFSLEPDNGVGYKIFDELIASGSTTSTSLANRYLSTNGIDTSELNIHYVSGSEFIWDNFVHFGSAEERVNNFLYKVQLIETYQNKYDNLISSSASGSFYLEKEKETLQTNIANVVNIFDGFEKYLYEETSSLAYPKAGGLLVPSTSTLATNWYDSTVAEAAGFDKDNTDYFVNNVPEFIKEDYDNAQFLLFMDMIGQHFDVIWSYINAINRAKIVDEDKEIGIPDKLVWHLLKSLGWEGKRAFDSQFLWEYAFGQYKDGTQKYSIPLYEANNQIWRRIVNNLPYLMKHKGTARAMKAVMACYGVPQSMLTIMEFGGPQDPTKGGTTKFTFEDRTAAIHLQDPSLIRVPWHTVVSSGKHPNAIEFRIKPDVVESSTILSGSEFSFDIVQQTGSYAKLQINLGAGNSPYIESPFVSASVTTTYFDLSSTYVLGPETATGSLEFPLSSTEYSNILINRHELGGSAAWFEVLLATAEKDRIKTYVSMSILTDTAGAWTSGSELVIGNDYNGMLDEFRLWRVPLQPSKFENHTLFPDAINGNSYTSSTEDLLFRLDFELPKDRTKYENIGIKNVAINTSYSEPFAAAAIGLFYSASSYPYQYEVYERTVTADVPSLGMAYSNKIRFEDTELVGELSHRVRATKKSFDRAPIDSSRLGLFFSPIKELNMDILKAFGKFNIDNYIGDPSDEYKDNYKELETLRGYYFERLDRNLNEYIQLVKNVDKSLFDVLADLAPARAKVSKGLLIEPHYLERSKTRWDRPVAEQNNYDSSIDTQENVNIESEYRAYNSELDVDSGVNLTMDVPFYDTEIIPIDDTSLQSEYLTYDSLIDTAELTLIEADAPFYDVEIQIPNGAALTGEADAFSFQAIGMDGDSLSNLGFGLYAKNGVGVWRRYDIFGNVTQSRTNMYLVKEQYTKKISTQTAGWPVNGALPGEQVVYENVPVTFNKYRVSLMPYSGSVSVGNDIVEVKPLNGYFPTHYRYTNNLGEGMIRSFWKGSQQTASTTPDGLSPVETFTTNPNILRVAKTGRGSGEPILEVD